jgi:hypothetical protein
MEIDGDDECTAFDFTGIGVKVSTCCFQGVAREALVVLSRDECLTLISDGLAESFFDTENLLGNDKAFLVFLDYVMDHKERVKSVMGEHVFNLLENYQNESLVDIVNSKDRNREEIWRLTNRVSELEAIIRNAKEALGVPHLTIV